MRSSPPITRVQRRLCGIIFIELRTTGLEASFRTSKDITKLQRQRHLLAKKADGDFRIYDRAKRAQTLEESARVFDWLPGMETHLARPKTN